MEQRFTAKDLLLFALLGLVMVMILLAMYMVDRQWQKMDEMQRNMTEQTRDMRSLRVMIQSLEERIAVGTLSAGAGTGTTYSGVPPAFERAHTASLNQDYAEGDWMVQAFGANLKTITPLISSDANAAVVQSYIMETLLTRNPETLEWEGLIARDWEVSEDGLTITFTMRDDVKFSDGAALTADDVEFSFDFIMDERIAAPRLRAYLEKVKDVRATSEYEVAFEFKEPYFNALSLAGSMEILPRHFYEPYLDDPTAFNQSKGLVLGSGPYRLTDPRGWTPDQGLVELERNPRYWGPVLPPYERLLWKVIENASARLTTFRNGDIDIYGARPVEYTKLLQDESLVERTQQFEYMSPIVGYSWIGWNQKRNDRPTRFADKRVRQAMTLLTDRGRIVEQIQLGYAEIAVSPFNPRSEQHNEDLEPREFNLERARKLLREAGFADRNGDGVLEDSNGKPFRFDLVYFQGNEDTKRIVLFLKDLYARAGVLMEPRPTEWSVMIDLLDNQNFDAITLGWTSGIETDIYQMFHSSQAIPGGDNFINYVNPELDRYIEEARATVEEDERMPLWRAAERILHEDQPYTFLIRGETLAFIDQRVHNLEITNLGLNIGIVPVETYVPAPLQKYQ